MKSMEIAGQKFDNVIRCKVKKYQDSLNNGKYYNIETPNRKIHLFTENNDLFHLSEQFKDKSVTAKGKKLVGNHIIHEIYADGAEEYSAYSRHGGIKKLLIDANGNVDITRDPLKIAENIYKKLRLMLKK